MASSCQAFELSNINDGLEVSETQQLAAMVRCLPEEAGQLLALKGKGKGEGKKGKGKGEGTSKGGGRGEYGKGTPTQGRGKRQEYRQCFNCYEYGHIGKDCPKPDKRTAKKCAKSFEGSQAGSEASAGSLAGSARSLTSTGARGALRRMALSELAVKIASADRVAVTGSCGNSCRVSSSIDSDCFVSRAIRRRTVKPVTRSHCEWRVLWRNLAICPSMQSAHHHYMFG